MDVFSKELSRIQPHAKGRTCARHPRQLTGIPRLNMPLAALRKRDRRRREKDQAVFQALRNRLGDGQSISPAELRPLQK